MPTALVHRGLALQMQSVPSRRAGWRRLCQSHVVRCIATCWLFESTTENRSESSTMSNSSAHFFAARSGALAAAVVTLSVVYCCEESFAQHGGAPAVHASSGTLAPQLADNWRRTVHGWEQLAAEGKSGRDREAPTQHVALVQVWPAAWAASVILAVLGLAATGAERKEVDACLARGDEVGYDLGRAA